MPSVSVSVPTPASQSPANEIYVKHLLVGYLEVGGDPIPIASLSPAGDQGF